MTEISVVIPTYNRPSPLRRAIESVLEQTYENFEIIVADDGSTDDIESVVSSFDDNRIRYIGFDENRGANAARNAGIEAANGRLISFLDSDDELTPTHLECVVAAIEDAPPTCGGAFTAFERISSGSLVNVTPAPDGYVHLEDVLSDNVVGGFSCITVRADIFEDIGLLDEDLESSQDYDFYIRLLDRYTLRGISEPLLYCHEDTDDRISDDPDRVTAGHRQIIQKHGEALTDTGLSRTYYARAFAYSKEGNLGQARRHFWRAIETDPTNWLAYYHLVATLGGSRGFDFAVGLKAKVKVLIYRLQWLAP